MASTVESRRDENSPYILTSAILSNERNSLSVEVSRCVSDFDIYEDIERTYLTGRMSFIDYDGIVENIKFKGDEKIKLTIKKIGEDTFDIIKTFYIDTIVASDKPNERTEQFIFHLVEDVDYESNLKNINKSYKGKPSTIIQHIMREYIPKREFVPVIDRRLEEESNTNVKLIVPNMDPLEAISWVKNKSRTINGMPYYLFTSLCGGDNIYYADLGTLLNRPILNEKEPYRFWQSATQVDLTGSTLTSNDYQIKSYDSKYTEDLYSIVKQGHVGGTHGYYDLSNGRETKVTFKVKDAFKNLERAGILTENQSNFFYPQNASVDDTFLSDYESKKVFKNPSNRPYETGYSDVSSFVDELEEGSYQNLVVGNAIRDYIRKNKAKITVAGSPYIYGDGNYTVGNLIELQFMQNYEQTTESQSDKLPLDKKKSGIYLITKTVHMFKIENYFINMDVCKIKDLDDV